MNREVMTLASVPLRARSPADRPGGPHHLPTLRQVRCSYIVHAYYGSVLGIVCITTGNMADVIRDRRHFDNRNVQVREVVPREARARREIGARSLERQSAMEA